MSYNRGRGGTEVIIKPRSPVVVQVATGGGYHGLPTASDAVIVRSPPGGHLPGPQQQAPPSRNGCSTLFSDIAGVKRLRPDDWLAVNSPPASSPGTSHISYTVISNGGGGGGGSGGYSTSPMSTNSYDPYSPMSGKIGKCLLVLYFFYFFFRNSFKITRLLYNIVLSKNSPPHPHQYATSVRSIWWCQILIDWISQPLFWRDAPIPSSLNLYRVHARACKAFVKKNQTYWLICRKGFSYFGQKCQQGDKIILMS